MPDHFQPGDRVVEIATGTSWKVLYHDKQFKTVTCEHTEAGRFIVRAVRDHELRLIAAAISGTGLSNGEEPGGEQ